jgi:hypothetical protein
MEQTACRALRSPFGRSTRIIRCWSRFGSIERLPQGQKSNLLQWDDTDSDGVYSLEETLMKSPVRTLALAAVSLFLVTAGAPWLKSQITNDIRAHIDHSFMIGDKTLPPGDYTFRMMQGSDLTVMTVLDNNGKAIADFGVRATIDNHRPKHSELVFRKYGDTEFLNKVFEGGAKTGVQLTETGKQEAHLVEQGQHAMEHSEQQQ